MKIKEHDDAINFIYILVSFPPILHQNSIRALEFSKRLVKERIFPIILTQRISKKSPLNYSLLRELPPNLNIFRTLYFESINRPRFFIFFNIFRAAFFLGFIPFSFLKIKKLVKKNQKIKFIYASGPHFYTHIIGYLLKRKTNLPLVVEYRDPWSYNPYIEDSIHRLIAKIDLIIEKKILKKSDVVITVSPALSEFLRSKFPHIRNKPIFSIANGLNIKSVKYDSKKESQEIVFTFTGTLYKKRDIIPLLRIISELKKEKIVQDLNFKMKIYGKYSKKSLDKIIDELNINDVTYLGGFIKRSKALEEIIKCDLAVHVGENLNYPTIAFKVWDYISCQKKILYLGNDKSYTSNFIKENDFGIVIPINNLEKGKMLLKNLINDLRENKFNCFIAPEKLTAFTWDYKAKKFLKIVTNKIIK